MAPPDQPGHTTYRLAQEPEIGTLWTYADRRDGGSYERVGGGAYDAATDTWGQGAFNADDVTRAAVVYLRDWQQTAAPPAATRRTTCCAASPTTRPSPALTPATSCSGCSPTAH